MTNSNGENGYSAKRVNACRREVSRRFEDRDLGLVPSLKNLAYRYDSSLVPIAYDDLNAAMDCYRDFISSEKPFVDLNILEKWHDRRLPKCGYTSAENNSD